MNRTLLWVGILLSAAGLITGVMPLSSHGVSCGSAFHRSTAADTADIERAMKQDAGVFPAGGSLSAVADACDSLRSGVRIPAVVLLLLGGGLAGGIWFVQGRRSVHAEGEVMVMGRRIKRQGDG